MKAKRDNENEESRAAHKKELLEMAKVYRMPRENVWRFIRIPSFISVFTGERV